MTWNYGYNVELGYTYGYYREQDPLWLDLCSILYGHCPPSLQTEGKLRYLELGCGQGLNLCLIAAMNPHIEFVGIDFNPQHIYHAQALVKNSGLSNIKFIEDDFVRLASDWPKELGKFHYVTSHGVLSWISPNVAQGMIKCIENSTLPGSLVYISYNTLPGWLSTYPVQHLLRLWQVREGLSSERAIDIGFKRLQKLFEINSAISRVLPAMKGRLDKFPTLDKAYLIQEYLHDNWRPLWFDEVANALSQVKLSYLGTASTGDWFLPAMLPEDWKKFYTEFTDSVERETMLDVLINQSFRRDIYVRGKVTLWGARQRELLLGMRFSMLHRPEATKEGENPYKFQTSLGEVTGKPEVYAPLYDALLSGPKSIAELLNVPIKTSETDNLTRVNRTISDILQAVGLMLNSGHLAIIRNNPERTDKPAKSLNRTLIQSAFQGAPYKFLIASTLPWVLGASDSEMILGYLRLSHPKSDAAQLGILFSEHLRSLGRSLIKDGQAITEPEALKARGIELAEVFLTKTLPMWQRLGVL